MFYDVIFSGFGGQGVLLAGDLLAFSCMKQGMEVTWFPSYGVEMRGGAASCTVTVSSEKIGSPLSEKPHAAICLSSPSLDRYQTRVQPGGLLIVNSSLIKPEKVTRRDLKSLLLPVNQLALDKIGELRMLNMIALGAFVGSSKIIDLESINNSLDDYLPQQKAELIPQIIKSLELGMAYAA